MCDMIEDLYIYNEFKKFESKFKNSLDPNPLSPFNAQIGFGVTAKNWKNQKYSSGCKGHKLLFKTHNIISSFCFNCYKIEIHPGTVLELFKLMFLFNNLRLENNNHRKLWLRPRKEIPVNYSGTIYFQSLDEAKKVLEDLKSFLDKEISSNIPIKVKRGCSEFNNILPNYHDINESYDSLVSDKKKWHEIENNFDLSNAANNLPALTNNENPSIGDFNKNHFRIMYTWLTFARSIGDDSYMKVTETFLDR